MNTALIVTAVAFVAGFAWGYKSPGRYCDQCSIDANRFWNRAGQGLINGIVLGGIVGVVAAIASA